jgi:hypothetical protein
MWQQWRQQHLQQQQQQEEVVAAVVSLDAGSTPLQLAPPLLWSTSSPALLVALGIAAQSVAELQLSLVPLALWAGML